MKLWCRYNLILCITIIIFFLASKMLFDKVFRTSALIIDEEFHLPQGLLYCNFTFNTWNPKITTLPGLYLVTALVMGPFNLCSVYYLRFINLIASIINLFLFYVHFSIKDDKMPWFNLMSSINLALLPPLYFFAHLYYTDVLSITFVLLSIIYNNSSKHIYASIFGAIAVTMRQTNIIWIGYIFGQYVLKELLLNSKKSTKKSKNQKDISWKDAFSLMNKLKFEDIWKKVNAPFLLNVGGYLTLLLSFLLFIFINGSIVVGDKSAHGVSLHLPQLFYFILFCLLFGWPFFLFQTKSFVTQILKNKVLLFFTIGMLAVIIHFNTLEHPYLLADNRHYTFYIWNRFYKKYFWFRFIMIPIYCLGGLGICSNLNVKNNAIFTLMYLTCTVTVLILQKMIEIRYFLIPFIIYRLNIRVFKMWQLVLECITFLLVNVVTFYIFYTKDIYWSDFEYVQKLIW